MIFYSLILKAMNWNHRCYQRKTLFSIYKKDMLRPILYKTVSRLAGAACACLLWQRFLSDGRFTIWEAPCLAVGANQGCLITDPSFEGADTLGKSKILAAAIRKLEADAGKPFDLIFCGREATDKASGQVGPQLAEALGVGVVTDLVDIQQTDAGVQAKQETEEGYRLVDAPLPCVVTVNKPPYDPRYPTIKSKLAARKMPIPTLDAAALGGVAPGAAGSHVVKVYEPAKRQAGVKLKEETCEETVAKAIAMMADAKVL